ncbi:hypothetical protein [Candidatus Contubernalis alkaliaceticus]|uniref:hypothetical protein n=1 Tax=Candidatus Contubernalis alkaliaceticus TaxID=338645 RepID=UPI001F4C2BF7|nr:hypothetical protein [Candidatus Contubernalis alkalaceticus]UNC92959.1 hypothetical protein HUE98_13140 [Candidatus Contubernalis alkalaceticus]
MELQNLQFADLSDTELSKLKETEQIINTGSGNKTMNEKGQEVILLAFVDKGRN